LPLCLAAITKRNGIPRNFHTTAASGFSVTIPNGILHIVISSVQPIQSKLSNCWISDAYRKKHHGKRINFEVNRASLPFKAMTYLWIDLIE
jgi:hypothetical protein